MKIAICVTRLLRYFDAQDRGLPAPMHKTFTSSHTFVTVPNIFFNLVTFHECFKYSGSNLFISLISWSYYFIFG